VHSHGRLSRLEVRELLYNSDALVLASKSEVQPLSLMEAMSTGIPVVATEVTPRSLRIGDGCHIVKTGDADALAEMMKSVSLQKDYDRRKVSEIIAEKFSPKAVALELEQLFLSVVEG
jgi:glycosyltransferase involved in cell wall biosynthesis